VAEPARKPEPQSSDATGSIKVRVLKFISPQDAPGLNVTSSVTGTSKEHPTKHRVEFIPRLRHFKITYCPPNEPERVAYIHESRQMYWEPAEG
jgi:hypothetical protein